MNEFPFFIHGQSVKASLQRALYREQDRSVVYQNRGFLNALSAAGVVRILHCAGLVAYSCHSSFNIEFCHRRC